jgi:ligand-binding sensor domain-containing protein/putative methionine-R-sulfoxide reductase with GAF domain
MNLFKLVLSLLLPVILAGTANGLKAQDIYENNFTLYTKQQGLSYTAITGMAQDSIGYIWIATASGLNRFNGSNFVQFHSGNDSLSLPQEKLGGLVWLDKRRLAVHTLGGLHIIDTRTGLTRNLFIPYSNKQYQFKFNEIRSVTSNAAGDIFLLTYSGFYHYDKNYQLVFRFDYYTKEEVATSSFDFGRKLLWVSQQELAVTSVAGIYYYNIERKQFKKMDAADCPFLREFLDYPKRDYQFFQPSPGCLFIMCMNADSLVYFNIPENKRTVTHLPFHALNDEFDYRSALAAVNDTLLYLTGSLSGFYKIRLYTESGKIRFYPKKYFPSYYCQRIMEDRDHNLWIATNKGLFSQDKSRYYIQQAPIPESLQVLYPNIVLQDVYITNNKLYAATRGNGGVLVFDKQELRFSRRIGFEKIWKKPPGIYSFAATPDRNLLVATNGPLCWLNAETNQIKEITLDKWDRTNGWISDLCRDRKDNIWIATGNTIYRYDALTKQFSIVPPAGIPLSQIVWSQRLEEDASGNIWVAGHGLIRYNTSSNTFDRFVDSFPFIKIPDKQVISFVADRNNNLWVNNNNNGLICYNIDRGTYRHFTRDDGLPDNNIAAMIIIGNKLWMATFSGIACLDMQTLKITSFGKEDGFPDQPISIAAKFFYDAGESKLYIGFANTVVRFDPAIIFQKKQAPHLFIESLTTGDQKKFAFPEKSIRSTWLDNEITITIGSINFFASNSQRFAYRLVKDDSTHWQQLGLQNTFSISSLAPGHHRIQVKIFSKDNRWPEQVKEIGITIMPPFWQQPWFLALAGLLLLLVLYLLLKWRTGTIRKKERAKTHIQELKTEEYKNQFELEQITNYFSSSLAGKKNVEGVLWDVTQNLISRMNYVDCIIYLWNEDKTMMIQKAAYGPKGDPKALCAQQFAVMPGQGVVGHVMQSKEPLLVPDTRKDDRYRVDDMARLCELCVPIIHNNILIGIIDSEHPVENHFKERDIKILTTIATLVGNKIKQIESEQSLEIKLKEIAYMNQQLAEAQLSALQTQMNPHFIFNSLNSIKAMILANERQKASRYLSKFAQMIRITLNHSRETFTTLCENIEHLESYLLMEKLRFDDSFTFRIIVDDDIDKEEILIPTLMIQPLTENAIWHGLMLKEGEKKLLIRFSRMAETISCTIEDNGIGINRSEALKQLNRPSHQSVGLSNLRNRIKIMNEKYDAGCTLEITDINDFNKDETGTCAVLRFNIIITNPFL